MTEKAPLKVSEAPSRYAIEERWPQFSPPGIPVSDYCVYSFEHLDKLDFMQPAEFALWADEDRSLLDEARRLLRCRGWKGDGILQLFWIPPFMCGLGDTAGVVVFHVKQIENGTSFLASPIPILGLDGKGAPG